MARVDFYLPGAHQSRERLACQLTLKAWRQGWNVFLRTPVAAQAQALDELLWQLPDSFLPHDPASSRPDSPILIGQNETPNWTGGLLIDLSPELSPRITSFERIIEIVDPEQREPYRAKFRNYRQTGYDPQRIEL